MRPRDPDRAAALRTYVLCFVLLLALLPIGGSIVVGDAIVAFVLLALVGALLPLAGRSGPNARVPALLGIVAFLAAVALLRAAAEDGSGYGALVLLPIAWAATLRKRTELGIALLGTALLFFLPQLLIGPPEYPRSGWHLGFLVLTVGIVIGGQVTALVRSLREAADSSAAIVAGMSEGLALTRDGEILAVNPALCRLTGLPESELVGATAPYPFWPEESLEANEELRRRAIAGGGGEFEATMMRAGGELFQAELTVKQTKLGDGSRAFLTTVRDVSGQRAQELAMRRRADELSAIAQLTRTIAHCDPQDARRTICRVAREVADTSTATIWEVGDDTALHNTCMLGGPAPEFTIGAEQDQHGARVVLRTGEPLFVPHTDSSRHCDPRMTRMLGAASAHYQPILGPSGPRGALAVSWRDPRPELGTHAALLLEVLAAEAASALERADLLQRLEELSRTDELTGLPNRRAWEELFAREQRVAVRNRQPLAVAMLDLDHFKAYNDLHGHVAGDRILLAVAERWKAALRDTDVLARWGGEEFGLLLPGCDPDRADALIRRLRGRLPDGVTFSAGLADAGPLTRADEVVAAADRALYEAKASGRNCIVRAAPAAPPQLPVTGAPA